MSKNLIKTVENGGFRGPPNVQFWVKNNIVYGVLNDISQKSGNLTFLNRLDGGGLFLIPVIGITAKREPIRTLLIDSVCRPFWCLPFLFACLAFAGGQRGHKSDRLGDLGRGSSLVVFP